MRSLFLDTSVPLLAIGGASASRQACRSVLESAGRGEFRLHLSVEAGQEFLFHRTRRVGQARAVEEFDAFDAMVVWHEFDVETLRRSRDLVSSGHARGRDAVHAASALLAGFSQIVSCDADFDDIPGLRRLDPAQPSFP